MSSSENSDGVIPYSVFAQQKNAGKSRAAGPSKEPVIIGMETFIAEQVQRNVLRENHLAALKQQEKFASKNISFPLNKQ